VRAAGTAAVRSTGATAALDMGDLLLLLASRAGRYSSTDVLSLSY